MNAPVTLQTDKAPRNYDDLLDQDSRPVPAFLREMGSMDVGPNEVPTAWFLEREYHDLEVEKLWKKNWQMVCREDDIAEPGDTWVYDIAKMSFVIVRTRTGEIKAFHNSCLHRGRALRDCPGRVSNLKCPFHGFSWDLDGELRGVPARQEFPTVSAEEFRLPEAKVATWGGFIFINPDPEAEPLTLDRLTQEYARWPLEDRAKVAHISKVLPANWKVVQDAFMEGFHVEATHPQLTLGFGDAYHRIDTFENFSRGILGSFQPSDQIRWEPTPQEIFNGTLGCFEDQEPLAKIPDDVPVRKYVADLLRSQLTKTLGSQVDKYCDAEMLDVFWYNIFPNFGPYAGITSPMVYLFRPNGDDHLSCIMDIMILVPWPKDQPKPPAAKELRLGLDELFTDGNCDVLGILAPVLNQDVANLDTINKGLINNMRGKIVFAQHHELKLRHFYKLYAEQLELPVA